MTNAATLLVASRFGLPGYQMFHRNSMSINAWGGPVKAANDTMFLTQEGMDVKAIYN